MHSVAGRLQITHDYAIKVCSKVYTFAKGLVKHFDHVIKFKRDIHTIWSWNFIKFSFFLSRVKNRGISNDWSKIESPMPCYNWNTNVRDQSIRKVSGPLVFPLNFPKNFISIEVDKLPIPCTLFKVADFRFFCVCFCAKKIQCIYAF